MRREFAGASQFYGAVLSPIGNLAHSRALGQLNDILSNRVNADASLPPALERHVVGELDVVGAFKQLSGSFACDQVASSRSLRTVQTAPNFISIL